MISSELLKLTNRELKNILRENSIKNYSKLNKKDLVNKVNKILNIQQKGGKKYKLKNLNGGVADGLNGNPIPLPSAPPLLESSNSSDQPPPAPPPPYNPLAPDPSAPPINNNKNNTSCTSKCSIL